MGNFKIIFQIKNEFRNALCYQGRSSNKGKFLVFWNAHLNYLCVLFVFFGMNLSYSAINISVIIVVNNVFMMIMYYVSFMFLWRISLYLNIIFSKKSHDTHGQLYHHTSPLQHYIQTHVHPGKTRGIFHARRRRACNKSSVFVRRMDNWTIRTLYVILLARA